MLLAGTVFGRGTAKKGRYSAACLEECFNLFGCFLIDCYGEIISENNRVYFSESDVETASVKMMDTRSSTSMKIEKIVYHFILSAVILVISMLTWAGAAGRAFAADISDPSGTLRCSSTAEGILISWQPAEGAAGYSIYRKTAGKEWSCIAGIGTGRTDFTDSYVIPKQSYFYRIVAYDQEYHDLSLSGNNVPAKDGQQDQLALAKDLQSLPEEDVQPMSPEDGQPMVAADGQPVIAEGIWNVAVSEIRAGTMLSAEAVEALGLDSFFYTEEISDETFARMKGRSFGDDCTMSREELRYIRCLHKDWHGQILVGELVMNQMVADQVCDIFRKLYEAAYPIERMVLIDEYDGDDEASIMENNTSAFNYRTIDDTDIISRHAYGLAIDINPYYNVYYIPLQNYIFPEDGWAYLDREAEFPYKLVSGDLCYELFREAGFEWGGWWIYNIDYQHFQFSPDAH